MEGILVFLVALALILLALPAVILFHAFLLKMGAGLLSEDLSWGMAVLTVVIAGFVQGCASGILVGADGGLLGALVGFFAWSAATSLLNDIELPRAAMLGLAMAVLQWLIGVAIVLLLVATGAAALIAAMAVA